MQLIKYQIFTVKFDGRGTGFWIGENHIISCYHLFRDDPSVVNATYFPNTSFGNDDTEYDGIPFLCKIVEKDLYSDLAILEILSLETPFSHPTVIFSDDYEFGDRLETLSYPKDATYGKSSDYSYGGYVFKEKGLLHIAFSDRPVLAGASGSPLFNNRTGKVCGLISYSIDEGLTGYNTIEGYGVASINILLFCKQKQIALNYDESGIIQGRNFSKLVGAALKPSHILKKRALKRYGYDPDIYLERKTVDDKLRKNWQGKANTVLVGKSLSGKSRAIYHNIKIYEPDSIVYILNDHQEIKEDLLSEFKSIVLDPDSITFFVINDIDEYLDIPSFERFLDGLISCDNLVILATCKKSKLEYFESSTQVFMEYFKMIVIPPIDDNVKKEMRSKIGKLGKDLIIDDTIGSFFIQLKHMVQCYSGLDIRSQEFLRSYKSTDIFLGKSKGKIEKIKDYTEKRLQRYHEEENWKLGQKQIDQILELLDKEGFLTYYDQDIMKVEAAYLERIIAKKEPEIRMIQEIMEYYPDVETCTKLISRVSDKEIAFSVFNKMKEKNISLETFTFTALIARESTYNGAEKLFKHFLDKEKEFRPDTISINTLINKANDSQTAYDAYKKFDQFKDLSPDEVTYFTLFGKLQNASYEEVLVIKKNLEEKNVSVPQSLYSQLIYRSNNTKVAFQLYEELKKNYTPTEATIMSLLKNVTGYADVLQVFLDAREFGISIDEQFIVSSAKRIKKFEGSLGYCNLLIYYGYVYPSYGIKLLLDLAPNFEQALITFQDLPKDKISVSATVYNALIRQAKKFEEGILIIRMMEESGINPSRNTYNSLLRIANRNQALDLFKEVFAERLMPDTYTFYHLISKSRNFNEAAGYYQQVIDLGLKSKISSPLFNILFKKAQYESDSLQCFEFLKETDHLKPEPRTLWLMINKSRDFKNSVEMLNYAIVKEFNISTTVINSILKNAKTEDQALFVFELMKKNKIMPSLKNYSLLIRASSNLQKAWVIYDEMLDLGHKPDAITFFNLMDKTSGILDAKEVFEEFLKVGGVNNTNHTRDKSALDSFIIKYFYRIQNFEDCMKIYNEYRKSGGHKSIDLLNYLLKYKRYKSHLDLVQNVIEAEELEYNSITYSYILEESENVNEAWNILKKMEASNILPNTRCGNFFIKKSKDYNEAFDWFSFIFDKYNLLPDKYTLIFLSKKSYGSRTYIEDLIKYYGLSYEEYMKNIKKNEIGDFEEKTLAWLLTKLENG